MLWWQWRHVLQWGTTYLQRRVRGRVDAVCEAMLTVGQRSALAEPDARHQQLRTAAIREVQTGESSSHEVATTREALQNVSLS